MDDRHGERAKCKDHKQYSSERDGLVADRAARSKPLGGRVGYPQLLRPQTIWGYQFCCTEDACCFTATRGAKFSAHVTQVLIDRVNRNAELPSSGFCIVAS